MSKIHFGTIRNKVYTFPDNCETISFLNVGTVAITARALSDPNFDDNFATFAEGEGYEAVKASEFYNSITINATGGGEVKVAYTR